MKRVLEVSILKLDIQRAFFLTFFLNIPGLLRLVLDLFSQDTS